LDDVDAWPDRPDDKQLLRLWTRLRVTTLGAIWRIRTARADRRDGRPFAHRVIALVINKLTEAIARDWIRTQQDVRTLDDGSFCSAWWRGFDASLSQEAFEEQWPPVFHRVQEQQGNKHLEIILTEENVPFPAAT
jgi:hypothetical protein